MLRRLRRALRRRERVVPVVLPGRRRRWERAPAGDHAAKLHLLYLRHRHQYLPAYFAKFQAYPPPRNRFTRAWRWYIVDVLTQALKLVRVNGRPVRDAAGVGRCRQLVDLLWLSVTLPSMPENYYKFELYRPKNRIRAGDFLHRHETKGALYEMLATVDDLATVAPLNDKAAFADRARAAGLAVTSTLAVVTDGEITRSAELPPADLFIKPLAGKGGRGAQKWIYQPARDEYRLGAATSLPRAGFVTSLAQQSPGSSLLVQACLENHPDLAELALDAVPTCRIITIVDEHGLPEPVIATFRMPAVPEAVVDNMHRGGIAAPVDLGSGLLGAASGYAHDGAVIRHSHHPVTGAVIEGRKLPLWPRVVELARRAHGCFPPRVLVGWDLAIGPDGPVLVEGNEQPGVDGLQRLHDLPLGSHRFGELLRWQLARRFP